GGDVAHQHHVPRLADGLRKLRIFLRHRGFIELDIDDDYAGVTGGDTVDDAGQVAAGPGPLEIVVCEGGVVDSDEHNAAVVMKRAAQPEQHVSGEKLQPV